MTHTSSLAPVQLQDQFGHRVAALLSEASASVPADIDTRLRFAREQALARARAVRQAGMADEPLVVMGQGMAGTLRLGRGGPSWWLRLGSALPVLVLAGGLLLIQEWQSRSQIQAAVEIDTALLSDTVPLAAYADPGFVQFLRTSVE